MKAHCWTPIEFEDVDLDLAEALRTHIAGRLHPDDMDKNALLAAERLILESWGEEFFPCVVAANSTVYFLDTGCDMDDSIFMRRPVEAATRYNAGGYPEVSE